MKTDKISQFDIGIVSPYRLQCRIIKQYCATNSFNEITIGPAEVLQGQEKSVVIVSTVRSECNLGTFLQNAQVGFISIHQHSVLFMWFQMMMIYLIPFNHQRFNVLLTRAKSLLIVVGNPQLLSTDANWRAFIEYCFDNNCLIQDAKCFFQP